jgi:hypothetical protein
MAHTKILHVHSAVLLAALQQYLGTQPVIHPAVAGLLMAAVHAHLKDDAAELGGLPPDAHIVAHSVDTTGAVSLILESQAWPWIPDGLPLAQIPPFVPVPAAAQPTAATASTAQAVAPTVVAAAPVAEAED